MCDEINELVKIKWREITSLHSDHFLYDLACLAGHPTLVNVRYKLEGTEGDYLLIRVTGRLEPDVIKHRVKKIEDIASLVEEWPTQDILPKLRPLQAAIGEALRCVADAIMVLEQTMIETHENEEE